MKRFLIALAVFAVTAPPSFAGYIIIRVVLEGGGPTESSSPSGPPGGYSVPGLGGKMGGGSYKGGTSTGPPDGYKTGFGGSSGGGKLGGPPTSTTHTNPGETDHTRSVVVVIPLETNLKEEALDKSRAVNKNDNPKFRKFVAPYYGKKLQVSLYVDSSSIQLYEELLDKPGATKTRHTEMLAKYAQWQHGKNDPQLLYDAMVLALRCGAVRAPAPKDGSAPKDALNFAQELLEVAAAETKPLPLAVDRFVKAWGPMSKAVRAPALQQSDAELWKATLDAKDVRLDGHYAVVYWDSPPAEVARRAAQLNDNFIAFYLTHAMRGTVLPVPTKPLVAVLAKDGQQMRPLNYALDGLPIQSDAFYAPDHGLLVLSPERLDGVGQTFLQQAQQVFVKGLSRDPLLDGMIPKLDHTREKGSNPYDVARATTIAAVEKLIIDEAEIAAVSREGSRQLLFVTQQLPKHVTLPTWLTNGAVSVMARPRGPAYVTIGDDEKPYMHVAMATGYDVPNYVLHRYFRDIQKDVEGQKDQAAARVRVLEHVLTDAYFAGIKDGDDPDPAPPTKKKKPDPGTAPLPKIGGGGQPPQPPLGGLGGQPPRPGGGSSGGPPTGGPGPIGGPGMVGPGGPPTGADVEDPAVTQRKKRDRLNTKAQATSWALYYYLSHEKPDLLGKYLAELNKQPRDLPIDGRTAYKAFVRVFKLSATDGGPADPEKLKAFAKEWLDYMTSVPVTGFDVPIVVPEPSKEPGPDQPGGPKMPGGGSKLPGGSGSGGPRP
jgi:hypothetical protein